MATVFLLCCRTQGLYSGGLLIEFLEELPDLKSLYEDSPRPRLGDRVRYYSSCYSLAYSLLQLVAYKPSECTVDETIQAEKRDQDAKNLLRTPFPTEKLTRTS